MGWTTADLLTAVKLKAFLTADSSSVTDANLLDMATEELLGYMVPNIIAASSGYLERVEDHTLVSGDVTYRIPDRAVGGKLSSIMLVDGSDREYDLPMVSYSEDAARAGANSGYGQTVAFVRNHTVHLEPEPENATTLRMVYYLRPGDLVDSNTTGDSRQISSLSSAGGNYDLVFSAAVNNLVSGSSVKFDIVRDQPGFDPVAIDQTASLATTSTANDTLRFSSEPSWWADVAANDWVALAGKSPIPQIPYELHPVLRQRTAARVFELLGDRAGMDAAYSTASRWEEQALRLLSPRTDNVQHKIVNTDGPRPLRGFFRRYRTGSS